MIISVKRIIKIKGYFNIPDQKIETIVFFKILEQSDLFYFKF